MNRLTSQQMKKWIKEISEVNIEKGWRKEGLEIADFTSNLHGEVSEAFEDYRNNKGINEVWYEYDEGIVSDKKKIVNRELYIFGYHKKNILGKPCGIPSELSDIVIRSLDMVGYYGWEENYLCQLIYQVNEDEKERIKKIKFTKFISELHECITLIFKHSTEEEDINCYSANLDWLIKACFAISEENNIDLFEQINDKIAYNRTRPARHGGKRV